LLAGTAGKLVWVQRVGIAHTVIISVPVFVLVGLTLVGLTVVGLTGFEPATT
jgi:hypothetical protein